MRSPADQVTAPPDQRRRGPSGQHAYVPVQVRGDDQAYEFALADAGRAGPARLAGTANAPIPRQGRAGDRPGRSRRGPARGYPPRPGDPAPRYPQPEFAAWNERPAPAPRAPVTLPCPAPAWAGPGDTTASASLRPGGGVAVAERPDGEPAGFCDDDAAAWAPSVAGEQAVAPGEPSRPASGVSGTARAAGVTRAAAARARKVARRKGRTRRRVMVAGVCLPAIAVVAAMAYIRHPGVHRAEVSADSHASSPSPSASQPSPSPGKWQHIATRAADPAPLTLGQLFPAQFTVAGTGYTRTAGLGTHHCSRAVFGTKLQAAARTYGCSQVMRASYLATGKKLMGTIGVLNLRNSAGANRVGKVTGSSQFIAQLTAVRGPTHRLTKGTGLEEAEVKGHYLILTWAEFTNLRAPRTASQRAQLKAFSANLINRTANVSLTSRMVTGEPQVP